MSRLFIPRAVYSALRAHGEETYPEECCGALLGRASPGGWRIVCAVRARNIRAGAAQRRYEIAPRELVGIESQARRQDLEIAGFYHSHPDHPATWSPTDFEEAHWLGLSYVITAVAHGKAAETNSFHLAGRTEEEKRFEPETVLVEDEGNADSRGMPSVPALWQPQNHAD